MATVCDDIPDIISLIDEADDLLKEAAEEIEETERFLEEFNACCECVCEDDE